MDKKLVKAVVSSLCHKKLLLMNNDMIEINKKFKSKKRKINMSFSIREKSKEKSDVQVDRNLILQSTIVRIMKSRKVLNYNNLVVEICKNVSIFKPEPKLIKRNVELLIEKEYLERSEDDHQTFKYLA